MAQIYNSSIIVIIFCIILRIMFCGIRLVVCGCGEDWTASCFGLFVVFKVVLLEIISWRKEQIILISQQIIIDDM